MHQGMTAAKHDTPRKKPKKWKRRFKITQGISKNGRQAQDNDIRDPRKLGCLFHAWARSLSADLCYNI